MAVRRTVACGVMAVVTVWITVWTAAAARQAGPPPLVGELILASYGGVTGAAIGTPAGDTDSPRLLGGNRLLTVAPDVVSVSPDGNYLLLSRPGSVRSASAEHQSGRSPPPQRRVHAAFIHGQRVRPAARAAPARDG